MSATVIKPESEKIESLRTLLSLVVENTKREMQGKKSQSDKEEKAVFKHLTTVLGREPEMNEYIQARKY
jgi:hypothetical protein